MNRKHIIRQLRNKGIEFDHNLSTKDLDAILNQPEAKNRVCKTLNFAAGGGKIKVAFNAANDDAPADITIAEDVGKDAWTGTGFALKDLMDALDSVTPKTRPLNFLIDSPGGDVNTGKAIHNHLLNWKGVINKTVIGVAASTASWMIPADTTRVYKNSQIFAHRAMCFIGGNRDDAAQAVEFLDKTDGQIATMYADQSGNDAEEMLDLMKGKDGQGTLMTGAEAVACGLADEIIDGAATNQFSADWLNSAKKKLAALNTLSAPPQGAANPPTKTQNQIMNKTQMLALLNKWGVTVPENATDEQIVALVNAGPKGSAPAPAAPPAAANLDDHPTIKALNAQIAANRRKDIQSAVDKAASDGKITVLEIENWVNDAAASADHPTNGNPVLARLEKLENRTPGMAPLPLENVKIDVINCDIKDALKKFESFNQASTAYQRGNDIPFKDIRNQSIEKNRFFKKLENRFMEVVNTTTIDPSLQRQFIYQGFVIRDFARRVLDLNLFTTVFANVPLQGTDVMDIEYYDLDATQATAFNGSYAAALTNTISGTRSLTIGWGPNKDGALGVGHARLVNGMQISDQDLARQPFLNVAQRAALKAETVAFQIWQDVLSVINVANFPALLAAGNAVTKSYDQFSSDDLADLKYICRAWPTAGRGLIIDSQYDANLMKDPTFKAAYQASFDSVKTEGQLPEPLYGFQYRENPNIPQNNIKLKGFAFFKSAILVGFAPVPPSNEVRNSGTVYELLTDAPTGIFLEMRSFGNNDASASNYMFESNYGFGPGLKTAIKPIVSP